MADLATIYDLEKRLGRDITDVEATRVETIIADVSASVRSYTGQTFDVEETTDRLKIRNGFVLLPQRPVTAVASVVDTKAVAVTSYTWDGMERVYVPAQVTDTFAFEPYWTPLTLVDVTYTHGYATVPADIVALVSSVALRSFGMSPADGGVTMETVDGYSYQRGSVAAAGGFGFFTDERAVLDRYRRAATSIRVFH